MRFIFPAMLLCLLQFPWQARAESIDVAGDGVTLNAELFRPDGAGPFPAVVAMHGCAGLYRKDGKTAAREADWAMRLRDGGFAVLLVDSFGSRGQGSQCRVPTDDRDILTFRERASDAFAALAYLQSRADVIKDRISLLGWSNGGLTVLHVVRQAAERAKDDGFAKAIAFYPPCRDALTRGNWRTRIPLLILIGEADDWTPPEPCRALAEDASRDGGPVSLVSYPGAYHDFDHPDLPVRRLTGLSATPGNSGAAHVGSNPAAREDAYTRVLEFLAR
jgi:dienelactone hydrolase